MQIECKIKRQGGSLITLGGKAYHFQPDDQGRHVAEVEDQAHIARLLEIGAYQPVDAIPVADEPAGGVAPQGGDDPSGEGEGEGEGDEGPGGQESDELEEARDAFEAYFGKKAHHAMKAETIWQKIHDDSK